MKKLLITVVIVAGLLSGCTEMLGVMFGVRPPVSAEEQARLEAEMNADYKRRVALCAELTRKILDQCTFDGGEVSEGTVGDTNFMTCTVLCNTAGEYKTTDYSQTDPNASDCWKEVSSYTSKGICPD